MSFFTSKLPSIKKKMFDYIRLLPLICSHITFLRKQKNNCLEKRKKIRLNCRKVDDKELMVRKIRFLSITSLDDK